MQPVGRLPPAIRSTKIAGVSTGAWTSEPRNPCIPAASPGCAPPLKLPRRWGCAARTTADLEISCCSPWRRLRRHLRRRPRRSKRLLRSRRQWPRRGSGWGPRRKPWSRRRLPLTARCSRCITVAFEFHGVRHKGFHALTGAGKRPAASAGCAIFSLIAPASSSSSMLPWPSVEAGRSKPPAEPHLDLATGAPLKAGGGGRCGRGAWIYIAR